MDDASSQHAALNACPKQPEALGSQTTTSQGKKYDAGKDRWDLLPLASTKEVVKVLTHGANKYGDWNWRKVDNSMPRYYAAAMRHITEWALSGGENPYDQDSKLHHLGHAICCLMFILEDELNQGKENSL